jgi:predicted GIY-YIG superfamily endonuclease
METSLSPASKLALCGGWYSISSAMQILLFRDPSPLVERLGRDFFRQLPECAGVYLMRGPSDELLYVGKAKNLRKRLGSYRVANPDRMPRRHLRLLRAVERIEIQECADESAALEREAELLRALRPRFNRAGTWPGSPKFLAWKLTDEALQLAVTAAPETDWRRHGPTGGARYVRTAVVRLLWFALHPARGIAQMPAGRFRGHYGEVVTLDFTVRQSAFSRDISTQLEALFTGQPGRFAEWILSRSASDISLFDKAILEADIEYLNESFGNAS